MPWMIPSNIAAFSGSAILALIFAFLYFQNRERHMGIWALGLSFHSLGYIFSLCQSLDWYAHEMPRIIQSCVLLGGLLLLRGSIEMARSRVSNAWWIAGGLTAAWVLLGQLADLPFFAQTFPVFTFFGLVSIRTGLVFLRCSESGGLGKYLTGWGFVVWGLHKFDYPLLRPLEWFAPWGFLLAAVLSLLVSLGMLLVYFQKMRDSLASGEKRLRTLVENSTDGIFLLDLESRILDVNPHACRSLGYSRQEILEMTLEDVVQDLSQVGLPRQANHLTPGVPASLHGLHRCKDGSTFPIEIRMSPISDEDAGELLLALARDISAQKKTEAELRQTSQKFQAVFNQTFQLIGLLAPDGTLLEANTTSLDLIGATLEEVRGNKFWDTPWWSHDEKMLEKARNAVTRAAGGELVREEATHPTKDGRHLAVDFSIKPIKDGSDQVVLLIAEGRDITERKLAEDHLRQSESRFKKLSRQFETLLDGIPDTITLLSPEWEVIWANKGAATAFGHPVEELSGRRCHELWHRRDTPCTNCLVTVCFRSKKPQENMATTADGRVWGIKVFPILNKDGRVTNALHLATEITEKIRLRKDAERSSRLASLGELAAGVAHEINNPIGLILMNLPVLIEAFADLEPILTEHAGHNDDFTLAGLSFARMQAEIPEMLSEMQDGATRIKRIVEDLKNFVRLDPATYEESVDLNQALQAATRLAATEIRRSTDHFRAEYAAELPPVKGVSQRIEQVLVNLIINACQALPDKSRGLYVTTRHDAAGAQNVIEVRDEGAGVDEKLLPHITDPFFTTRRQVGGTGLGLSVSTRIVKEHGGEIRFSSAPGQGTTVTVLLPAPQEGCLT